MTIGHDSWHFKTFLWFEDEARDYPTRVNLCPYVRAVFLWAPLAWLFVRGKVWRIPVAAVSWFCVWLTPHTIAYHYWPHGTLVFLAKEAGVFAFIGAIGLIAFFAEQRSERIKRERKQWLRSQMTASEWSDYEWNGRLPARLIQPKPIKPERFAALKEFVNETGDLLAEYASAIHNKICPIIQVK